MGKTSKIKKYSNKTSFEKEMEKAKFNLMLTGVLEGVKNGMWLVQLSDIHTEEIAFKITPDDKSLDKKVEVYMDPTGEQVVIFDLKNLIAYSQVF